jgi:hypothetical protein
MVQCTALVLVSVRTTFCTNNDVLVFDIREGVAVLEIVVGILLESFIVSYPHFGEVVSVARAIIGRLVIGREEARQCCLGGDALCWEIVEPQEWRLAHNKGEVSRHVVFAASRGTCCDVVHLKPYTWDGATVVLLNAWLEVFGYLIVRRRRENVGKLLTAPGLANGA